MNLIHLAMFVTSNPKDDSILEFFIDDDGLKKLEMHAKELKPVNPWDDTPIA